MSDIMVKNIIQREYLESENKILKTKNKYLNIFVFLTVSTIFCLIIYLMFAMVKQWERGYENAVEDFYNGKLKCDRIEDNGKVKYIWIQHKG